MRIIRFIATIPAFTALSSPAGEWQELFNGRDPAGWEARSKADWRVQAEFRNIRIRNLDLP